jgi:hypothetical protein
VTDFCRDLSTSTPEYYACGEVENMGNEGHAHVALLYVKTEKMSTKTKELHVYYFLVTSQSFRITLYFHIYCRFLNEYMAQSRPIICGDFVPSLNAFYMALQT